MSFQVYSQLSDSSCLNPVPGKIFLCTFRSGEELFSYPNSDRMPRLTIMKFLFFTRLSIVDH